MIQYEVMHLLANLVKNISNLFGYTPVKQHSRWRPPPKPTKEINEYDYKTINFILFFENLNTEIAEIFMPCKFHWNAKHKKFYY